MSNEKKLSKKALSKSFHNWYWGHLTCFSQEHMQTFGYLHAMLPLCDELYAGDEEAKAKAMSTYTAFFNTEPQLGTVIVGMTAGLEESRANGDEEVDDERRNVRRRTADGREGLGSDEFADDDAVDGVIELLE